MWCPSVLFWYCYVLIYQAMLVENASLRESLAVIQRELVSLLNEQQRRRDRKPMVEGREEEEEEEGGELGPLTSGHFQMPYDIVRDGRYVYCTSVNPRCACAARVTVLDLCLSVC